MESEFENVVQRIVVNPQDISDPVKMARKEWCMSYSVNPAIKLPDHTPVIGSGTATKLASVRYLWMGLSFPISRLFVLYLFIFLE